MKLDDQLKNTFDHFEPEVDPSVWAKVSARLVSPAHVVDGGSSVSSGVINTLVAKLAPFAGWIAGASAIIGLGIILELNSAKPTSPVKSENIQQNSVPVVDEKVDSQQKENNVVQRVTSNKKDRKVTVITNKETITRFHQEQKAFKVQSSDPNNKVVSTSSETSSAQGNQDNHSVSTVSTVSQSLNTNTSHSDRSSEESNEKGSTQINGNQPNNIETSVAEPVLILNTRGGFAPLTVTALTNQNGRNVDFNFGDGTQINNVSYASHRFEEAGIYTVRCNIAGRELVATVEVLGQLPSVFSPNGDGINDQFVIGGAEVNSVDVHIYDRSGRIMLSGKGKQLIWDGTISGGQSAETGTYFYDIFATSISGVTYKQKGTINLFR